MSRRRRPARRHRGLARALSGVLVAPFVVVALASAWAIWNYRGPGPTAGSGTVTRLVLARGSSAGQIATALQAAGAIRSRTLFLLADRLAAGRRSLKAGEYEFPSGAPMDRVLADIQAGRVVRRFVAVPEGWTSDMAVDAVRAEPLLAGEVATPPEGSILPDSYQVQRGEDRAAVVARMRAARDTLLAKLWAGRASGLPLNRPQDAVTLASLVEKETGVAAERPRIAAVFENRLRVGMKLESDPTVIYGVSQGRPLGRGITMKELMTATPYNTYRIVGLPPTPIANPGRAALAAVLNPPRSTELFFVADGTGGHVFASTYAEHQANVAKWRGIERARAAAAAAGK